MIPLRRAHCVHKRDRRDKPGDDGTCLCVKRKSSLPPRIDGNRCGLGVAPADHAERALRFAADHDDLDFFRLEQPADLRGIYVYVGLETGTNSPDAVPLRAALKL